MEPFVKDGDVVGGEVPRSDSLGRDVVADSLPSLLLFVGRVELSGF